MPNFTPNSKIYIGRVPFDASYRHTMTFANAAAQQSYFASVCTTALNKTDYTYVRMNNSIRVPFNAESLYTYNYVMYQNANYGTKWFYAFIIGVNYVNENVTELVLQLDVMQTWYFDYTLVEGFVEREHPNSDNPGENVIAEPSMDLQHMSANFDPHTYPPNDAQHEMYAVLLVTAYPNWNNDSHHNDDYTQDKLIGSTPQSGATYYGMYNGCKALAYNISHVTPGGTNVGLEKLIADLYLMNEAGAGEAIVDAYLVPRDYINEVFDLETMVSKVEGVNYNETGVKAFKDGCQVHVKSHLLSKPTTCGTYTPRNKKLLTFPFTYLEVGDFNGRYQEYRWEYFKKFTLEIATNVHFDEKFAPVGDGEGYLTPLNYMEGFNQTEINENMFNRAKNVFPFTMANKISWVFSAYQNWRAQNELNNQLAVLGSVAAIGMSMPLPGLGASAAVLGAALNSPNSVEAIEGSIDRNFGKGQSTAGKGNMAGVVGGIAGLGNVSGQYYKMHRVPNSARGNIAGNSRYQYGYNGFYFSQVTLLPQIAECIDDFFDMYGYATERVKVPNRTGRTYWNYVKMQNSCHRGNVPASDMALINEIYNKGITFWHTSDVGNYSLNNAIGGTWQ